MPTTKIKASHRCQRCRKLLSSQWDYVEAYKCCKDCMSTKEEYDNCAPWITKLFQGIPKSDRKAIIRAVIIEKAQADVQSLINRGYLRDRYVVAN